MPAAKASSSLTLHARSAENRADENGISRERLAHILHIAQHIQVVGIIGVGVRRRRFAAGHYQPGFRLPPQNQRQHLAHKPVHGHPVGFVAEAAHEQHGQRLAPLGPEFIARGVDARAQSVAHPGGEARQIRQQVIAIRRRAHLHLVEPRQHAQFVAQRAQIFVARLQLLGESDHVAQPAPDRLEIDIVLEEGAGDAAVLAAVLRQRGVFELQHVDALLIDLAVDQPVQIFVGEFVHRVRQKRTRIAYTAAGPHQPLGAGAETAQFFVVLLLPLPIQQFHHVHFGQPRQLPQRLVHEDAAAVHRRADGIRRNEQHAQGFGRGFHGREAIAEIAAQRAPERFGIAHHASRRARHRERQARGNCVKARHSARKFGRSGTSPNSTASSAPAQANRKCASSCATRECSSSRTAGNSSSARPESVLRGSACRWCRGARDTRCCAAGRAPSSRASRPCSRGRYLPGRRAPAVRRSRPAPGISRGRRRRSRRRRRSTETGRALPDRCDGARAGRRPATSPASGRSLRAAWPGR